MIPSFDASRTADELVPVEILRWVQRMLEKEGVTYVFIGALARDLVVHAPSRTAITRATRDIDLAVAVEAGEQHRTLLRSLGEPSRTAPQRVIVERFQVDVIPFAGAGAGTASLLGDSVLDVTGLSEAARRPTWVMIDEETTVPVAGIDAQAILKVLAWRDRRSSTQKDALDFGQILSASSMGLFADLAWEDDAALEACEGDIVLMGPYRLGRSALSLLGSASVASVVEVLESARTDLTLRMGVPESEEMLDAFRRGLDG